MNRAELTALVRRVLLEAGFDAVGIAPAVAVSDRPSTSEAASSLHAAVGRLDEWLAAGRAGEMDYMAQQRDARADPNRVLPGARSVVAVALAYRTIDPANSASNALARISRYAWATDYHDVLRSKLNAAKSQIETAIPGIGVRGVVDSAPVMERDYAQLAGLGWIGKNTLLLDRRLGSWFFLGALLVDRELDCDEPFRADHCGSCTRCLDACPTAAFDGPYRLDPNKCIGYLTVEHKTDIPELLAPQMGDWLFGCDVCQDVCPWNDKAPAQSRAEFTPPADANPVDPVAILRLDDAAFRRRFRGTSLFRAKRVRVLRNACIVVANRKIASARPVLQQLADGEPDPVLRRAAARALKHLDDRGHGNGPAS